MDVEEVIVTAIKHRKSVVFDYNRPGKVGGQRTGNPHALFKHSSTNKAETHIFQTDGVSDSGLSTGPSWRLFIVDYIKNPRIIDSSGPFAIAPGYNSSSPMYVKAIEKL